MTGRAGCFIQNRLEREKRDINIYHHGAKSAHIISYNNSITLSLGTGQDCSEDYLHISAISGPGDLVYGCWINLPRELDFECTNVGKISAIHSGDQEWLYLPPGPAVWQLKINLPVGRLPRSRTPASIYIGDEGPVR